QAARSAVRLRRLRAPRVALAVVHAEVRAARVRLQARRARRETRRAAAAREARPVLAEPAAAVSILRAEQAVADACLRRILRLGLAVRAVAFELTPAGAAICVVHARRADRGQRAGLVGARASDDDEERPEKEDRAAHRGTTVALTVPHRHEGQLHGAVRPVEHHSVAVLFLQQRAPDRRLPAHVAAREVDLVLADDAIRRALSIFVFDLDGRPEEDARLAVSRLDDLRELEPLGQKVNASIDLAELLLAADVLGVLAAIALSGRVGHV